MLRIDGHRSVRMLKEPYILRMKEKYKKFFNHVEFSLLIYEFFITRWGESVRRSKFNHDITIQKEKHTGKKDETYSDVLRQKLELMIENSE